VKETIHQSRRSAARHASMFSAGMTDGRRVIFGLFIFFILILSTLAYANENILNVYTWSEEIPEKIIKQFEKETGIDVNYSSFDSNEIMFAKLRTNRKGYDVVEPSSYYIERMQRQHMLEVLNKKQLPNYKNLDPFFINQIYDSEGKYSIPFLWGVTGIVINTDYYQPSDVKRWSDFLSPKFFNQLMLLDEARGVFSPALRMLGYSVNDINPKHLQSAFYKLKQLLPNVRLFNSDAAVSILIDEDANIGMAWNGDIVKAMLENPKLQFIFPEDGFEIWVDNFVILKDAPHKENAYRFLNFLLRPDIAMAVSREVTYATANLAARQLLPDHLKNNPILYPSYAILKRGEFQSDIGEDAAGFIEKYWELLKMGG
jgi:spermidine/putrescine transport system substrate-binding protein